MASGSDPVARLPHEIMVEVLLYLPMPTIAKMCCVSRRWNNVCSDPWLWRCCFFMFWHRINTDNTTGAVDWKSECRRAYQGGPPPVLLCVILGKGEPPVTELPMEQRTFTVGRKPMLLGRNLESLEKAREEERVKHDIECDIRVVDCPVMSGCHCKIWYEQASYQFYIRDWLSHNGTWVSPKPRVGAERRYLFIGDRNQVQPKQALSIGSCLKLAEMVLEVRDVETGVPGKDLLLPRQVHPSMSAWVIHGPGMGLCVDILSPNGITVGRTHPHTGVDGPADQTSITEGNALLIDDPSKRLSRRHLIIERDSEPSETCQLTPLSKNGVLLGPEGAWDDPGVVHWRRLQVNVMTPIRAGDLIRCGRDTIVSIVAGSAASLMAPPNPPNVTILEHPLRAMVQWAHIKPGVPLAWLLEVQWGDGDWVTVDNNDQSVTNALYLMPNLLPGTLYRFRLTRLLHFTRMPSLPSQVVSVMTPGDTPMPDAAQ